MLKQLLEALQNQFPGVDAKILNRTATKLAKTVTDDAGVADAVKAVTFQQLLESYGDYRATESQMTAVSNYESKHHLKDGKPVTDLLGANPVVTPKPTDDDTPAWAKTLMEQNQKLTDRLSAIEGAKIVQNRKERLQTITKNLPDSVRKAYDRMDLKGLKDDEFEALVSEITPEVEGISKDLAKKSVFGVPIPGKGPGDEKVPQSVLDGIKAGNQSYSEEGNPF